MQIACLVLYTIAIQMVVRVPLVIRGLSPDGRRKILGMIYIIIFGNVNCAVKMVINVLKCRQNIKCIAR